MNINARAAEPGSEGDPVVTKSYVDARIAEIMGASPPSEAALPNKNAFEPVFASRGQKVLGKEGAEIILRSGSCAAYCPGSDGLVNATRGLDLADGAGIDANNLILIPRDDGRGVLVSKDAWFIIKGGYEIN
ncbi:MAG: hypothetical protein LBU36_02550 [Clostridiales bacterium]|jgi:hypothetical protein|nr:hypothetical protein [Clostridiales bacterium]